MQRHDRHGPLRLDRFQLETFGERLQLAMRRRGKTGTELGAMIHADKERVSLYVRDKVVPNMETMIDIADALDVSIDWLVGRKPRDREVIYRE